MATPLFVGTVAIVKAAVAGEASAQVELKVTYCSVFTRAPFESTIFVVTVVVSPTVMLDAPSEIAPFAKEAPLPVPILYGLIGKLEVATGLLPTVLSVAEILSFAGQPRSKYVVSAVPPTVEVLDGENLANGGDNSEQVEVKSILALVV